MLRKGRPRIPCFLRYFLLKKIINYIMKICVWDTETTGFPVKE